MRIAIVFVLCSLVHSVLLNVKGEGTNAYDLPTKEILLNYGAAYDSFSMYFKPERSSEQVVAVHIDDYEPEVITDANAYFTIVDGEKSPLGVNISCEFSFEGLVGETTYNLVIKTVDRIGSQPKLYTLQGMYVLMGFSLVFGDGSIASGERAKGISFASYEDVLKRKSEALRLIFQGPLQSRKRFNSKDLNIRIESHKGGVNMGVVDTSSFEMINGSIIVAPRPYRVSDEPQMVILTYLDLESHGEVFETMLTITVPNTVIPPPVVTRPETIDITLGSGSEFDLQFFNLRSPPQKKTIKNIVVNAVGDSTHFTIATEEYLQHPNAELEETLHFISPPIERSGQYEVKVDAYFEDGSKVSCHMERGVKVNIRSKDSKSAGLAKASSYDGLSSPQLVGIVIGSVAGLAVVVLVVVAMIQYKISRESDIMESSFSRSGPIGAPLPYGEVGNEYVLRDAYARTGSSHSHIDVGPDADEDHDTMTRTQSATSSHCSF